MWQIHYEALSHGLPHLIPHKWPPGEWVGILSFPSMLIRGRWWRRGGWKPETLTPDRTGPVPSSGGVCRLHSDPAPRPITVTISLSQPGVLISLSFQRRNLSERERVSGESFQLWSFLVILFLSHYDYCWINYNTRRGCQAPGGWGREKSRADGKHIRSQDDGVHFCAANSNPQVPFVLRSSPTNTGNAVTARHCINDLYTLHHCFVHLRGLVVFIKEFLVVWSPVAMLFCSVHCRLLYKSKEFSALQPSWTSEILYVPHMSIHMCMCVCMCVCVGVT